jgi:hypothetical protein
MPAQHANNATAAVVSIYREESTKFRNYSQVRSALTTALLASMGEANRSHLRTAFPALKSNMLIPRQVVGTMCLKHSVASSDVVTTLKEPLTRALTSLSNLTSHMNFFLLASQRLTRSGQGETDFSYFKSFLETVSDGLPLGCAQYAGVLREVPCYTAAEPGNAVPLPGNTAGPPGPVRPSLPLFRRRQRQPRASPESQKGKPKATPYARQKGQSDPAPQRCTVSALGPQRANCLLCLRPAGVIEEGKSGDKKSKSL